MYGAQTRKSTFYRDMGFENDVEMYGAQTNNELLACTSSFENDVEMYGAQTQRYDVSRE